MVELILQKYEAGIATYRCIAEGNFNDTFTMSINLERGEITELSLPEENTYSTHALYRVLDVYRNQENKWQIPTHTMSMWY